MKIRMGIITHLNNSESRKELSKVIEGAKLKVERRLFTSPGKL
jgi:hypothetical protein